VDDFVCCRDKMESVDWDFRPTTRRRRTCYTIFAYKYPIKTDRKRTEEKNRSKKGEDERVWSVVHIGVQVLHRRRRPLRVQGGRDERMDGWTTNEGPRNKKLDERREKGVKRTKDKSHESANGQICGSGATRMHTFAAAEEGGGGA
jgi:hypothetical protein